MNRNERLEFASLIGRLDIAGEHAPFPECELSGRRA